MSHNPSSDTCGWHHIGFAQFFLYSLWSKQVQVCQIHWWCLTTIFQFLLTNIFFTCFLLLGSEEGGAYPSCHPVGRRNIWRGYLSITESLMTHTSFKKQKSSRKWTVFLSLTSHDWSDVCRWYFGSLQGLMGSPRPPSRVEYLHIKELQVTCCHPRSISSHLRGLGYGGIVVKEKEDCHVTQNVELPCEDLWDPQVLKWKWCDFVVTCSRDQHAHTVHRRT